MAARSCEHNLPEVLVAALARMYGHLQGWPSTQTHMLVHGQRFHSSALSHSAAVCGSSFSNNSHHPHNSCVQELCRQQNVTVTLFAETELANGTSISHTFRMQQSQGTVFDDVTVTHLASPTQLTFTDLTAMPLQVDVGPWQHLIHSVPTTHFSTLDRISGTGLSLGKMQQPGQLASAQCAVHRSLVPVAIVGPTVWIHLCDDWPTMGIHLLDDWPTEQKGMLRSMAWSYMQVDGGTLGRCMQWQLG